MKGSIDHFVLFVFIIVTTPLRIRGQRDEGGGGGGESGLMVSSSGLQIFLSRRNTFSYSISPACHSQ